MKTSASIIVTSLLAIASLVLTTCTSGSTPTPVSKATSAPQAVATRTKAPASTAPASTPKPSTEQPRSGGTLKIADLYEQKDYDIHQASSIAAQAPLAAIYNGLLQFDPLGDPQTIVADIAEKWDVSADGKGYTFNLRKDVKWHDGKPLTSEDVKFSIDRQANPPKNVLSPRKAWFEGIDKIETPDANTVRISLQFPRAAFVPFLASGWSKIISKNVVDPLGDAKSIKAQVGTGPFKFKEYNSGVIFQAVKNPDYFIKGRPYLDAIDRYYIKDDATRFASFRTHRINMASLITMGFSPAQADIVEKEMAGKATVHRFPGMVMMVLSLNMKTAPFSDVRTRKAVALALDRGRAKGVVVDEFKVGGFLPPGGKWALPEDELSKMPGYRQPKDADRAEAKRLLTEAGYPDGLKVKLLNRITGVTGEVREQFLQDQLKTVGIQLELGALDQAKYYSDLNDRRFTMASVGEGQGIDDPDAWFTSVFHSKGTRNYAGFEDKEIDSWLEQQARTMDEKQRKALVLKAQRKIMDLAPVVETYWNWGLTGSWNEVKNWTPGIGIYERSMFQDVWLAQ